MSKINKSTKTQEAVVKSERKKIQKSINSLRKAFELEYSDYVPVLGVMIEQLAKAMDASDIIDAIQQKNIEDKKDES